RSALYDLVVLAGVAVGMARPHHAMTDLVALAERQEAAIRDGLVLRGETALGALELGAVACVAIGRLRGLGERARTAIEIDDARIGHGASVGAGVIGVGGPEARGGR